ncbi:MAG: hypothetical protein AAF348_19845 [Bacteroidota bacterium]
MNRNSYSVLIVEDNRSSEIIFERLFGDIKEVECNYDFCTDFTTTKFQIERKAKRGESYDLAILDIRLPGDDDFSGQTLAELLLSISANTKIIFNSSLSSPYRFHQIFKLINPRGYLVKHEHGYEELKEAVKKVIKGDTYFTESVKEYLTLRAMERFNLDDRDMEILYYASIGTTTKDIPELVSLSLSSVEKRKHAMAKRFGIQNATGELLRFAKENGIL